MGYRLELCHDHVPLHLGLTSSWRPIPNVYEMVNYCLSNQGREPLVPSSRDRSNSSGHGMVEGSTTQITVPGYVLWHTNRPVDHKLTRLQDGLQPIRTSRSWVDSSKHEMV